MKLHFAPLALAVLVAAPLAAADHRQARTVGSATSDIVFEHDGENEWWVEVLVHSPSGDAIVMVLARHDQGGGWHSLKNMALVDGKARWATNSQFVWQVPPGTRVQFQAAVVDSVTGDQVVVTSCYFTHPAGVEQCDPGSTDPFTASFRNPSGNEWWEQVYVSANKGQYNVWALRYGNMGDGVISELKLRDWGAWAGSYYAPRGTIVQFQANRGLESVRSSCWNWPDVTPAACPSGTPPPAQEFTFDHRTGNEWWVEVVIGPRAPANVQARDEGGPWVILEGKSWGAWAASFHIEPGHKVQFRALEQGSWHESCWFTHPQGLTPTGGQTCTTVTKYAY